MTQPSAPDPFEFVKMLWGPMGLPVPGLVTPTFSVAEIDKRIAELKSVDTWLTMNLNLLKMSVQGLEMQRAMLLAMQAAGTEAAQTGADAARSGPSGNPFADAWWNVLQQAQAARSPDKPGKK